jgi:hypothetical protein
MTADMITTAELASLSAARSFSAAQKLHLKYIVPAVLGDLEN